MRVFLTMYDAPGPLSQFRYFHPAQQSGALTFVDFDSGDSLEVTGEAAGRVDSPFLTEMSEVTLNFAEGEPDNEPVALRLPATIELSVVETIDRGGQVSPTNKPAILSNRAKILVPPHIKEGDAVIVNTESRTFSKRA